MHDSSVAVEDGHQVQTEFKIVLHHTGYDALEDVNFNSTLSACLMFSRLFYLFIAHS